MEFCLLSWVSVTFTLCCRALGQHLHAPSLSGSYSIFVTVIDTSNFLPTWVLTSASPLTSPTASLDLAFSNVLPFSHAAATHTYWSVHPVCLLSKCVYARLLFLSSTLTWSKHPHAVKLEVGSILSVCYLFYYSAVFTQTSFQLSTGTSTWPMAFSLSPLSLHGTLPPELSLYDTHSVTSFLALPTRNDLHYFIWYNYQFIPSIIATLNKISLDSRFLEEMKHVWFLPTFPALPAIRPVCRGDSIKGCRKGWLCMCMFRTQTKDAAAVEFVR